MALTAAVLVMNAELADEKKQVEDGQERLLDVLRKSIRANGDSPDTTRWPKLMLQVAHLRSIAQRLQAHYCNVQNASMLVRIFGIRNLEQTNYSNMETTTE